MRRAPWVPALLALLCGLAAGQPVWSLGKPSWARPFLSRPTPTGGFIAKNDDWVVVYSEVEYSLSESGALRQYHRYIIENVRDKPKFFQFDVDYDEGAESLSELQINVDRGSHWSEINVADHSVTVGEEKGGQTLYTSVQEVEPGMRVVLEYFLQDKYNHLPYDVDRILSLWPTGEKVFRVASKDRDRIKVRVVLPDGDSMPPCLTQLREEEVKGVNLPASSRIPRGYPNQPDWFSLYPWVVVYATPAMEHDASYIRRYSALWEEARKKQPEDKVAEKAKALTAGASSFEEKLRRVGDFVQHGIQYDASNNNSMHAWVPLEVSETLRSLKGDCKGKTLLAQSLLAAVGIESRPVLIRMEEAYYRWEREPATALLNHVILAVKNEGEVELPGTLREGPAAGWILCDPVQLAAGFGEPLPMYEGDPAFLVGDCEAPRFTVRTAVPSTERSHYKVTFKVAASGAISGDIVMKDNGASPLALRVANMFGSEDINLSIASSFPATMNRVHLQDVKVLRADKEGKGQLELRAKFTLPNASQSLGESLMVASPVALACNLFGLPNGYWPPTPPTADDRIEILPPWDNKKNTHGVEQRLEVEAELELPPGFLWAPPAPKKEATPFLECEYVWSEVKPGYWKASLKLARHRGCWPSQDRKTRLKMEDSLFSELSKTLELKKG